MNNNESKPGIIAYRLFLPEDQDLIDNNTNSFKQEARFYPTKQTTRSIRENNPTGITLTYDTRTKMPHPVLWVASERAIKNGIGAPNLTVNLYIENVDDALKAPNKWEMYCPKCGEHVSLKEFMDTRKYSPIDFTELFCPHDGDVQMLLRKIN